MIARFAITEVREASGILLAYHIELKSFLTLPKFTETTDVYKQLKQKLR
jgi:hypothetical protein